MDLYRELAFGSDFILRFASTILILICSVNKYENYITKDSSFVILCFPS